MQGRLQETELAGVRRSRSFDLLCHAAHDQSNAELLESVSDGVFDHAVRRELVEAFLADPRSLLLAALASGRVHLEPEAWP